MDLKDEKNKDELLQRIDTLTDEYKQYLTALVHAPDGYKKAALLYYWLRDYKNYLRREKDFDPKYYPSFQRGNIVNVNLGFNVDSEMGGLHYAIVLQDSNRKSPTMVIAPMKSVKPHTDVDRLRDTDVYIGNELYHKIEGKYIALRTSIPNETALLKQMFDGAQVETDVFMKRLHELENRVKLLQAAYKKLQVLKSGSIVVLNQIRTVSKLRLEDPINQYDILYKLKVSGENLTKIDTQMQALFIKSV